MEVLVRDRARTRAGAGALVLAVLYALNGIGWYFPATLPYISFITVTDDGREGWIELVEALMWIVAAGSFALAARRPGPIVRRLWLALFALVAFVAFGEEISWGQQLGLIEPPAAIERVNAQNELNLHNTDVAALLGIGPEHVLYPYLGGPSGVTSLLNPLFMLGCVTIWSLLPALVARGTPLPALLRAPVPHRALRLFVLGNALAYLLFDKLLYDVSELLELGLAMSGLFVSRDLLGGTVRKGPSRVDA